jgi:uncharacterized membrane protein YhaH (DUF805 family)
MMNDSGIKKKKIVRIGEQRSENVHINRSDDWKPGIAEHIATVVILFLIMLVMVPMIVMDFIARRDLQFTLEYFSIYLFFLIPLFIVIEVLLLYQVYIDSLRRGMPSPPIWILIVFLIPFIGLILYYIVRPEGKLSKCPHCSKERLAILVECPHCKYRKKRGMRT